MSTDFQMNYHHNKDNLHVKMQGIFDGNSAHELLNLFLREYRCGGRVFVDTAKCCRSAARCCRPGCARRPFRRRSCSSRAKTDSTWRPPGAVCLSCRPARRKAGAAENARTAHAMANTGMGTGTEDAHVAANTITIINFFPSGAFS